MIQRLLNTQTKSISFASLILAGSYFASASLGLFRDRLLASNFGAGNELDAYYAAFTVPDFIALILVFGAISAAIIPIFNSYYVKSEEEAWGYVSNILNTFLTFLIIVCLIFIILAPFFVSLIAPGFSDEKRIDTIMLMRIMFLSPIILGISSIISGILQTFHRFFVTALAPIMYNLGIIMGILFFVPKLGISGLAWGVVFGGLLHLIIQIPALLYSGFVYKPNFNIWHPGVLKTFKLMIPRSMGLGAGQFNTVVITAIASTLTSGSVAIFNLANNLSSIFVNAIAVSISTAIFPSLSQDYLKADKKDFEKKFFSSLLQIIFLIVPISVMIFILRAQIVRVILGTGKFGWTDTRLTAACLGIFGLGLCFQGLIFITSKTFYAAHNTKIPAFASIATVIFNVLLSLLLVWLLSFSNIFYNFIVWLLKLQGIDGISVIGLSLSYSISAVAEVLLLLFLLYKKFKLFEFNILFKSICKIITSSAIMAFVVIFIRQWLVLFKFVSLETFLGVFLQLSISGMAGVIIYIAVSYYLKSKELEAIRYSFFEKQDVTRKY